MQVGSDGSLHAVCAFSESENAAAFAAAAAAAVADRAADTLSPTFFPLSRYLDT